MKQSFSFRAVIFDLDGLVLDSESTYFKAWRLAAQEMGYSLDQTFCESLSGMPGSIVGRRLLDYCGEDFDIAAFSCLSGHIWRDLVQHQGIPVKYGFHLLLERIKEHRLPFALATNSRRGDAEQCLAWSGLGSVFSTMICRDDVYHPKPAADVYIKAATALGLDNSQCLVLEDSAIGVAAAVAAGCPCIYVPSLWPADPEAARQARHVMKDLAQVADFISASGCHPL